MEKESLLENMYSKLREAMSENGINERLIKGEGAFLGKVAFIGEAPGGVEEKSGRPFVGSAGKNLEMFLNTLEITREDIYITNVVKWRPKAISKKSGKAVNRTPKSAEIELCAPFLFEELKIIEPKIAVTLGNVALKALTGDNALKISDFHGKQLILSSITIFPLYHPASVIYNRALLDVYEHDLEKLKSLLEQ